jgi:hypothetical protein
MTNTHGIDITDIPLDAPGVRIAGSIAGEDVNLFRLEEITESLEENLKLTEKALNTPETNDLTKAVRGALLNIDSINFHLIALHRGIVAGNLNYPDA